MWGRRRVLSTAALLLFGVHVAAAFVDLGVGLLTGNARFSRGGSSRKAFGPFHVQSCRIRYCRLTNSQLTPRDTRLSRASKSPRGFPLAMKMAEGNEAAKPMNIVPLFILLGIINRVVYRIQLVPMKEYTYFISQFVSLCYVVCYGTLLLFRRRANIVTSDMLAYARNQWYIFASIGFLESLCFLIALYSAARIPGSLLGVLGQAGLLWTVLCARIMLGKRFEAHQLLGLAIVLAGTLTCTIPQAAAAAAAAGLAASRDLVVSMSMYFLSTLFSAVGFTLKERAFRGANLDIFVVSTTGSAAQCLFTLLLLPLTFALATSLPPGEYLRRGWAAFTGTAAGAGAAGMPWLAFAYVAANLGVNIAGITLLKRGGAVSTSIAGAAMVPLTGLTFCLDLPLLGAAPFRWSFVAGLAIVAAGTLLYNHRTLEAPAAQLPKGEGVGAQQAR